MSADAKIRGARHLTLMALSWWWLGGGGREVRLAVEDRIVFLGAEFLLRQNSGLKERFHEASALLLLSHATNLIDHQKNGGPTCYLPQNRRDV